MSNRTVYQQTRRRRGGRLLAALAVMAGLIASCTAMAGSETSAPPMTLAVSNDTSGFDLIAAYNGCIRTYTGVNQAQADACRDAALNYGVQLTAEICVAVKHACRQYRIVSQQKADFALLSSNQSSGDDINVGDVIGFFIHLIYKTFDNCLNGLDQDNDSNEMYINDDAAEGLARLISCGIAGVLFGGAMYGVYRAHKWLGHNPYKRHNPHTYSPINQLYMVHKGANSPVNQGIGIYNGYGTLIQGDPMALAQYNCVVIGLESRIAC